MKLYNIKDMDRFMDIVESCNGGITLKLNDREIVDVNNEAAVNLLRAMRPEKATVEVKAENADDTMRFVEYMLSAV
ncbi:MAG: hypothetical protein J5935_02875 [Lachnospiraceae bacterium]|nr:hypothetical protein [Lachnospiraceae bacterium]